MTVSDDIFSSEAMTVMRSRPVFFGQRIPGHNVDRVDVPTGLRALADLGFDDPRTAMVIDYALGRWARGEEMAAERAAIDRSFHGIDLTSWRVVLATAMATGEAANARRAKS